MVTQKAQRSASIAASQNNPNHSHQKPPPPSRRPLLPVRRVEGVHHWMAPTPPQRSVQISRTTLFGL